MKAPPLASTPRRCIFCLKLGTTDEHIFGDWLRVAFPRTPKDTRTQRVTRWGRDRHGKIYAMPESTIQQGHSGSKKVPYVCAGCNNGWMSRMETRTRRILMPLIQGLPHTISTFEISNLRPIGRFGSQTIGGPNGAIWRFRITWPCYFLSNRPSHRGLRLILI